MQRTSAPLTLLATLCVACSNPPSGNGDGGGGGQGGETGEAGGAPSEGGAATGGSGTEVVLGPARRLALGTEYGCALDTSDTIACWGSPTLDDGQTQPPPGAFSHLRGFDRTNCAFDTSNHFECWGAPFGYARGDNTVDIGIARRHGCILRANATIDCAGDPGTPETMPPVGPFLAVAAAPGRSCAIRDDGSLICWGTDGANGHLGVPAGTFSKVAMGEYHQCAIREDDGSVSCWGAGKEGDPNGEDPVGNHWGQSIPPSGSFRDICAGLYHTCAIRADGTLACWGQGTQVGDCETSAECGQAAPPGGGFWEVECGASHSCAVAQDGTVTCWGSNNSDRATPPAGLQVR